MSIGTFIVITFNICNFNASFDDGLKFLLQVHNQQRNDVFVLEETFLSDFIEKIESNTALNDAFPYHTPVVGQTDKVRDPNKRGVEDDAWDSSSGHFQRFAVHSGGVIILSKYPIEQQHQYVYREGTGWQGWFERKGCVLAQIRKDNKLFNVVGTHLQADLTPQEDNTHVRLLQMEEMGRWLGKRYGRSDVKKQGDKSEPQNPVPDVVKKGDFLIIAGDLNMPYDGPNGAFQQAIRDLGMQHFIRSKVDQAKTDKGLGPPLSVKECPISYSVSNNEFASYKARVPMNGKDGKTRKQLANKLVKEGKANNDLLDYILTDMNNPDGWVEDPQQLIIYDLYTAAGNLDIGVVSNLMEQETAQSMYDDDNKDSDRSQFIKVHAKRFPWTSVFIRDVSDHYPAQLTLKYKIGSD